MSRRERDKGARGEREVATVLRDHGLEVDRTPNSGGLHIAGDVTGLAGYHVEVKRQETLRLPLWVRQATDEAPEGAEPVVVYRQSGEPWRVVLELDAFAKLVSGRSEG
jgi:Holliday junction resolvase